MKLNIKPIKQGDTRWATKTLPGGGTVESIGCLTCCLSMSLNKLPPELLGEDIFNGNYVDWGKFAKVYDCVFEWLTTGDFEAIIRSRADKGLPTIIRIKKFEHFVLAIGYDDNTKEIFINDPLKGETYFLKATDYGIGSLRLITPAGTGTTAPDGSSEALEVCMKDREDFWKKWESEQKEHDKTKEKLAETEKKLLTSQNDLKSLEKEKAELSQKVAKLEEAGGSCQSELESANKKIAKLEEEKQTLAAEKANYKKWYEAAIEKSADKLSIKDTLLLLIKKLTRYGQKRS